MKNINTAIYIRVSTEEQALHGFSIRAQKEKLIYYSTEIKGWNVYDIYIDEGISGKDIANRPALIKMIDDIKQGKVNNVLVFKIDRLTRSTKDLIDLVELFNSNDCDFNSLNESIDTTTATGRMFIKIIGIFAEFERENIVERVKLGIERKVKEGYSLCSSTPPFGYDRPKGNKILIINSKESIVVKEIFDMFLNGTSITKIARILNLKKIKTKKDKTWSYKSIKLILTNSTYIGKVRHRINKKDYFETKGFHEAIIDIELYEKVQRLINTKSTVSYDAYFSHILKCKCGSDMVPKRIYRINKYGKKIVYINYRCKNKKDTCNKDISHNKLENLLNAMYPSWCSLTTHKKFKILREKSLYLSLLDNGTIRLKN